MKTLRYSFLLLLFLPGCFPDTGPRGTRGSISENGTGGFWKLESCKVRGQLVDANTFPDKTLLEAQNRVVSSSSDAVENDLFRAGTAYHQFSFFDQAVARKDSFSAVLWNFDNPKKNIQSQWYKISDDAGVMVRLTDIERELGVTKRIELSNVIRSGNYKAELDTVSYIYIPTEKFK